LAKKSSDLRSPTAKAYHWASRIMTVSLEMVVPGLVGLFVFDRFLGTEFVFCLLGFAGGLTLGIWHLIKLTSTDESIDTS
jgi:hypothetical protein